MAVGMAVARLGRSGLFAFCKAFGGMTAVGASRWRDDRLLILGYHGVSMADEHVWNPDLFVSPQLLESRLALLKRRGCSVLPLGEALTLLDRGQLPPRSVVLTFDDGMANFGREAYQVLAAYGYPATVYLTTYYCLVNRPVFNLALSYVLWKARQRRWAPPAFLGLAESFDLDRDGWYAWIGVIRYAERERLSAAEKDELVATVAQSVRVDYDDIRERRLLNLLDPGEVARLKAKGVDFQLHTHRHRSPEEPELMERELLENRDHIRSLTGTEATHFCYPNGDHRSWPGFLAGKDITSATTCNPGLVSRDTPRLLLPRFLDTSGISPLMFEAWVSGLGHVLSRRQANVP